MSALALFAIALLGGTGDSFARPSHGGESTIRPGQRDMPGFLAKRTSSAACASADRSARSFFAATSGSRAVIPRLSARHTRRASRRCVVLHSPLGAARRRSCCLQLGGKT